MKSILIDTWAPLFSGFYNTIFDGDDGIETFLHEEGTEWDKIEFDNKEYTLDTSKEICNQLQVMLEGFVTKVVFQELRSPKYYNYGNDSINIEVELSPENIMAISEYIYDNREAFADMLKDKYTGCPGYIPFHSNEFADWEQELGHFTKLDGDKRGHKFGQVLNFILTNEGHTEIDLYYSVRESVDSEMYCALKKEQ